MALYVSKHKGSTVDGAVDRILELTIDSSLSLTSLNPIQNKPVAIKFSQVDNAIGLANTEIGKRVYNTTNAWISDSEDEHRWYYGKSGSTTGFGFRAVEENQYFNLYSPDKTLKFSVEMNTGEITEGSLTWSKVTDKPSTYPSSPHTHDYLPLAGGTLSGNLSVQNTAENPQLTLGNSIFKSDALDTLTIDSNGEIHLRPSGHESTENSLVLPPNGAGTYCGYRLLTAGNYSSFVTPAGIGAAASSHNHTSLTSFGLISGGNATKNWQMSFDNANYVFMRDGTATSTIRFYPDSGDVWFSGTLTSGTVPWARVSGAPTSYPASDVSDWAKAATPDSINLSNNDSIKLAVSGGTNLKTGTLKTFTWTGFQNSTWISLGGISASAIGTLPGGYITANIYLQAGVAVRFQITERAPSGDVFHFGLSTTNGFSPITFAPKSDFTGLDLFAIVTSGTASSAALGYRMLKIEKGTMATDWSPAPQDKLDVGANAASSTKLATARTLTIGSTGKTFDGSANVSWSLAEIGAAASSHSHSYLPLSGGGTINYSLGGSATIINSTNNDANAYNQPGTYGIAITGGNNILSIGLGSTTNDRKAFIQSGHNSPQYATAVGELWLNPLGGTVRIGAKTGNIALHTGNYTSYAQKTITSGTANPSGGSSGDIYLKVV